LVVFFACWNFSAVQVLSVTMNTRTERQAKRYTATRRMPRILRNWQYKKQQSDASQQLIRALITQESTISGLFVV